MTKVSEQLSPDGMRMIEVHEGDTDTTTVVRDATVAEQVAFHQDEILRQVVGMVPSATGGTIAVDETRMNISLYPLVEHAEPEQAPPSDKPEPAKKQAPDEPKQKAPAKSGVQTTSGTRSGKS